MINLTPSGRCYTSAADWRHHPESIAFLLRTLDRDLTQGAHHVQRHWYLWRLREFIIDAESSQLDLVRNQLPNIAGKLMSTREALKEDGRVASHIAAKLLLLGNLPEQALLTLEEGKKSVIDQPVDHWGINLLGEALVQAKRWDDAIRHFEQRLKEIPGSKVYMSRLADALENAGRTKDAATWRAKADPAASLVGKVIPDHRIVLQDGSDIQIHQLLKQRKAVLLNFWFRGCAPCQVELPMLNQLDRDLSSKGLSIISINSTDTKEVVSEFIAEKSLKLPICVLEGSHPLLAYLHIEAYPTNVLIDHDGKIVWRSVGFNASTKKALLMELRKLGISL